jgi:hypothetical protein
LSKRWEALENVGEMSHGFATLNRACAREWSRGDASDIDGQTAGRMSGNE